MCTYLQHRVPLHPPHVCGSIRARTHLEIIATRRQLNPFCNPYRVILNAAHQVYHATCSCTELLEGLILPNATITIIHQISELGFHLTFAN